MKQYEWQVGKKVYLNPGLWSPLGTKSNLVILPLNCYDTNIFDLCYKILLNYCFVSQVIILCGFSSCRIVPNVDKAQLTLKIFSLYRNVLLHGIW